MQAPNSPDRQAGSPPAPSAHTLRDAAVAVVLAAGAVGWAVIGQGLVVDAPSFGRPEILTAGAEFQVRVRAGVPWVTRVADAALEKGTLRFPLSGPGAGARVPGRTLLFRVPAECPPGNYDLVVRVGAREGRSRRAVSVLATIPERFTVAQITDLHVGYNPEGDASVERIVDAVNSTRPDLVVVTGDIAHNGLPAQYERAQRILAKLTMPFVTIPGNHDRRGWGAYLARFGPPFGTVAFGRWTLLALDCGHGRDEFTESQYLFIRKALDALEPRRVIVLAHIPLAGARAVRAHAGEVMRLLEGDHVPLVLSGHLHYGTEYRPPDARATGTPAGTQFVVTVTAGGWLVKGPSGHTDPRGFTLVTVDGDRIASVTPRPVKGVQPAPEGREDAP